METLPLFLLLTSSLGMLYTYFRSDVSKQSKYVEYLTNLIILCLLGLGIYTSNNYFYEIGVIFTFTKVYTLEFKYWWAKPLIMVGMISCAFILFDVLALK